MKQVAAVVALGLVASAGASAGPPPIRAAAIAKQARVELGASTSVGFRLLRGGTPVTRAHPTLVARSGTTVVTAPAARVGGGRYTAHVRPTALGAWTLTARVPGRTLKLGGTTVIRPRLVETYKAIVEPEGTLVVADGGRGGGRLIRVDPRDGRRVVVAGNGGERFEAAGKEASAASLGRVYSVARSPGGELYAAVDNRIVKIAAGRIVVVAGNGRDSSAGDGGPATRATLSQPVDLVFAPNGDLLVAELGANRVRRISSSGTISTVTTAVERPFKLAFSHDGSLLVTQLQAGSVYRIGADGGATTFLDGMPVVSGLVPVPSGYLLTQHPPEHGGPGDLVRVAGDGTRTTIARNVIREPSSLATAPDGAVYITAFDPDVPLGRIDPDTGEVTPLR